MRVLVTGGSGYIGSVTVARLLQAGHEVHVFDNLEMGHREALPPEVSLHVGDLRDAAAIGSVMERVQPAAVMHFAAYALVGESMLQPETYFGNNVSGGLNLVEAMRHNGVTRLVFSSTCATYGEPPDGADITEATPQLPTNPYGESKLIFEKILNWYSRIHGFKTVALRYFNACGATETLGEDHANETHLIPLILQVALGQRPEIKVFGTDYATPDGSCIRDYIHVADLAEAHLCALERGATGAFNLGTGQGFSVLQVLDACRRVTGCEIPAVMAPRRPGDPARLVACAARAQAQLGWQPQYRAIDSIIATAWRWHRQHPDGY